MELNRLSFNPRKRNAYEIFDLTVLFTKQHFIALFSLYMVLVMPVFILAGVLFGWSWSAFIIWLLKPLFERPILDYVSKVVFNQPATIYGSLKSITKLQASDLFINLTLYRLSPNRAFLAPVTQLEKLHGTPKEKRKLVLFASSKPKQTLWMIFCVHLEFILLIGITAITFALIPTSLSLEEPLYQVLESPLWVEVAFNTVYVVSVALVAPLFVTGGFMAYLHRRIDLEGWDIELIFKNMRVRLSTLLSSVCLVFACSFFIMPSQSMAESGSIDKSSIKEQVTELYAQDNVIEKKTTWTPDFDLDKAPDSNSDGDYRWLIDFFKALGNLLSYLVWPLVGCLVMWLLYLLFKNRGFFTGLKLPEKQQRQQQEQVIPTLFADLKQQHIPDDLIAAAKSAYQENNQRLALAYLLHFSLNWAQHKHHVKLHRSMTERECKLAIDAKVPEQSRVVFTDLFSKWVKVAWGHQSPAFDFPSLVAQIEAMAAIRQEHTNEN